jgi:hypothetical protein
MKQRVTDPRRACRECNGFGVRVRLLASVRVINALAEADVNEPVATREETCTSCFGSGSR